MSSVHCVLYKCHSWKWWAPGCGEIVAGSEPSSIVSQESGNEFIPIGSQVTGKAGPQAVLVRVSIAVIKHHYLKEPREERVYFSLQLVSLSSGKSGQKLKIGT